MYILSFQVVIPSPVNDLPLTETVSTGSTQESGTAQYVATGENQSRVDLLCHENMGSVQQYENDDDYDKVDIEYFHFEN